jgi:hypothetical protein
MPDNDELSAPPPDSDDTPPEQPADPGHPGLPPGTKGTVQRKEKDKCGPTKIVTWALARDITPSSHVQASRYSLRGQV